jgi:hypothetical protein
MEKKKKKKKVHIFQHQTGKRQSCVTHYMTKNQPNALHTAEPWV